MQILANQPRANRNEWLIVGQLSMIDYASISFEEVEQTYYKRRALICIELVTHMILAGDDYQRKNNIQENFR